LTSRTPRRSIDELFGQAPRAGVEDLANAKMIDVTLLEPNPYQPRTTFDGAALAELAADIKEHGLLQPLLVRPRPDRPGHFQIVAGERRWRAAPLAGLLQVPCIEQVVDDAAMERLALIENVQRADLDPLDEAHALKRLMERLGLSQRELAETIHKDHSYVGQRLHLIEDPRIESAVRAKAIGPTVAVGIARLDNEARRAALIGRIERGDRVTVEDVRDARAPRRKAAAPDPIAPELHRASTPSGPVPVPVPVLVGNIPHSAFDEALGTLNADVVDAVGILLAYGVERAWSCQELLQAIREHREHREHGASHP